MYIDFINNKENFIFAFQIFVGLSSAFTILKNMSVFLKKRKIKTWVF